MNMNDLPERLKEEILYYLYSNNLVFYKDFKIEKHLNFNLTPIEVDSCLYSKAKFYNLALQKLLSTSVYKNEKDFIQLVDKYLISDKYQPYVALVKALHDQYQNENFYKSRPSSLIILENKFIIDEIKKFVYLKDYDLQPDNIHFADNQLYNVYSKKYPQIFERSKKESDILTYEKTPTSLDTSENITELILEAMRQFAMDIDKNHVDYENSLLMAEYNKQTSEAESQYQEEVRIYKEQTGNEMIDISHIKLKEVAQPKLQTTAVNMTDFMDTAVLFICSKENEKNKQEQLRIINDLYNREK